MNMMDAVILPMHPEGRKFVAIFAVIALVLGQIWEPLFWVGWVSRSGVITSSETPSG